MALSQELRASSLSEATILRLDAEALRYIPAGFAIRHDVLPYAVNGSELTVAVPNEDSASIERIRLLTGMQVRKTTFPREIIRKYLALAYASATPGSVEGMETFAPATVAVDELHEIAIRARASDIHLEPLANSGQARLRIDGQLTFARRFDVGLYAHVVSRFKILAGMDISDRRQPQDGRYTAEIGGASIDARVSSMPTLRGERLVIRLFDPQLQRPALDMLGMPSWMLERYRMMIRAAHGFIIVCGPTGSGKTTTLYATLETRKSEREHICTVEDPIEIQIPDIAQVQVNNRAGMTFARALRAFLRQDPNVIMVGEMRDSETANVSISAALSGQLVLTSLHSPDAIRAIDRLLDLAVPRHAVAAALTGIVAQRLVRVLCTCRRREVEACEPVGCELCDGSGYRGRTAIFEMLEVSDDLREAIASGEPALRLAELTMKEGRKSLSEDAARQVAAGQTSISEVRRALGKDW